MALLPYQTVFKTQPLLTIVLVPICLYLFRLVTSHGRKKRFPEINPPRAFTFGTQARAGEFMSRSRDMLVAGRDRYSDEPYTLHSNGGEVIVLPPALINEMCNHPSLNFTIPAADDGHGYIPGFEPFQANDGVPKLVTRHLSKELRRLIGPMSQEASHGLKRTLTDSTEWHEIDPKGAVMLVVSQITSRIFMGVDLCRDEKWTSSEYTTLAFQTSSSLAAWPRSLRPYVHWLMPSCWRVRSKLNEARSVLAPHLEKRNRLKQEAASRGETIRFDDTIEWFENEVTHGQEPAINQISLSLAAIHTTSDLVLQVILDLAQHSSLIAPLRTELIEVLATQGLTQTSLYNLELMDSVIKESQRMKPTALALMRRLVTEDLELSQGTKLYKGERVIVDPTHMWSSSHYPEPQRYDGYRFLRMRDEASDAHLVSTSAAHVGFGHGRHACPGRFFAAHEIKIALSHLLLKYEWKLVGERPPRPLAFGMAMLPDPEARLVIRRRRQEIDIDALETEGN
ncbi:hypothetical protein ED733_002262 [Metarhizium rileyi]|uniref:Cytochrome P450 n=1 Tax=Metarhizium rileyi (strain RCEF 4871) TaxID=1649241 RepID=A0A5C6GE96_METRR|nr:hypothetical protein ED733_002262 [Metarhizium rileyi]